MASLVCAEEVAYNEIKQWILNGKLAPGARLVHRSLAKQLGVSPNPVVLALRMLERDGLVVNTPGLGACVRTWTRSEMIDLYRIRAVQEGLASRLCAERVTPADMAALLAASEAFKQSTDSGDIEANIQADVEFHAAVVRGTHCPDLERLIENLAIMRCSMRAFGMSLNIPRLMSPAVRDVHDPIVEAIVARDPVAAERAGRKHVEDSLERNLAWIEEVAAALVNGRTPHSPLHS